VASVIVQSTQEIPAGRSEIAAIEWMISRAPAYQEADMGRTEDVADREKSPIDKLDEVTNLLMASLQESRVASPNGP